MTKYSDELKQTPVIFENKPIIMSLGEVLEKHDLRQLRIAETEKYPHVTYFFSGGKQKAFINEDRLLIPSPKVATYDLQPEMSAPIIAKTLKEKLGTKKYNFICANFANPDMVGHTGVLNATVHAIEVVDTCLKEVVTEAIKNEYSIIILSDHGNAEFLINNDQTPNTAHTINPVPIILIDKDYTSIRNGSLADVAPTILKLLNLSVPCQMTGTSLV